MCWFVCFFQGPLYHKYHEMPKSSCQGLRIVWAMEVVSNWRPGSIHYLLCQNPGRVTCNDVYNHFWFLYRHILWSLLCISVWSSDFHYYPFAWVYDRKFGKLYSNIPYLWTMEVVSTRGFSWHELQRKKTKHIVDVKILILYVSGMQYYTVQYAASIIHTNLTPCIHFTV